MNIINGILEGAAMVGIAFAIGRGKQMSTGINQLEEIKDMTDLASKCCDACRHWTRLNADDLTAPEGECACPNWRGPLWFEAKVPSFGYHPHTLKRDYCSQFKRRIAA